MKVKRLNWPPQSPDLAPIENLWKILKNQISGRHHRIRNIEEMGVGVLNEWENIPEETCHKLAASMVARMDLLRGAKFY